MFRYRKENGIESIIPSGNLLEPSKRLHWIGTLRVFVEVGVPGKLGGRQWRRKLGKQAKHGTK
jgi:hypothetical protein